MAFSVPALPYAFDALEPHIDAKTMEIHHDKHHQAYVDNANKALAETEWADSPVEEVLAALKAWAKSPRTSARRFRTTPAGTPTTRCSGRSWARTAAASRAEPSPTAINEAFGGFDAFKEKVTQNGVTRFGSGWTWLVWNGSGLEAYSTANQDSPLMQGHVPLLGIDVWEHAYYLNYQNRRPDYLAAWWNVVNWDAVAAHYGTARS